MEKHLAEKPETNEDLELRPELIRILLGLFLALSLVSQGRWDPDPLSLVWPSGGIANWFGLPGALFAGFWLRFFGYSSLTLVFFLLFAQSQNNRVSALVPLSIHFMVLVILIGLLFPPGHPYLEYAAGLLGLVSNEVMSQLGLRLVALLVLSIYLIKAATGYRFQDSFIRISLSGIMGVWGLIILAKELIMQLKELTPAKLKEAFGKEPEINDSEVKQGPVGGDLLRRALAELKQKATEEVTKEENVKK